ncbi:protein argonaute 2-like [Mustela erminea]|uniref:protein argonaute 2-like n=1 Tax=Mustela erminea TaxID=36723 RepID=UPI001386C9F9|nr:protein argonaute 2-like [Mustela erminea]
MAAPSLRGSVWTWKPRLGVGIVWRQLGRPAPPPKPFYPALPPRPLPEGGLGHLQTLPAEPSRRRGLPRRLARPPRRARTVGAFPAASRCSGIQQSRLGIAFLATKPAPGRVRGGGGGLLFGAGAGGHPARGQRESARVCVLDCSSGDSGGRGRGGGGDASRRAGEAGGGAKWKPGSREPGARAGGTAGAPRRDEAPRARGHPVGGWRGRGAAGAGGGWAPGSGRLASRSPPRALPRSLPGLPVSRPSSPRRRRRRQQRASTGRAPRAEPQRCPRLTPYVPPGPPAAVRGARQLGASTESYCFLAQVCCRTHGGE